MVAIRQPRAGDINTRGVSYKALATATEANAMKDLASIVQQGKEIDGQKHGMNNFIQAGRLKAINDTQTEMSTGEFGKENDYRTHAQQNAKKDAKYISDVVATRAALDGSKKGTEAWSADKVAMGQAAISVNKEMEAQGVSNALTKEGQPLKEAIQQAMKGSELRGRISENSLLGTGKKWAEITAAGGDLDMMKKVQDNAEVKELGGITVAHKAIEKAGNVDKAIGIANTLAEGKATADYESIDRAGSKKEYIKRMGQQGRNKMSDTMGTQDQYVSAYNAKQALKEKTFKGSGKFYDPSNPKENQAEFDEFVRNTEFNKASVKSGLGEFMTVFGEAGGYILGGAALNHFGGKPIQKGYRFTTKQLKKISPFHTVGEKETLDGTKNHSDNDHGTQSKETIKNEHTNSSNKFKDSISKVGKTVKGFVKGGINAAIVDATAGEVTQYLVDEGDFKTANALKAGTDVVEGVWGTITGAAVTAAGVVTQSPSIQKYGMNMINNAGQSIANAVVHTEAAINGDNNVYGMSKGGNTLLGDLTGYGSLSQMGHQAAGVPIHAQTAFSTQQGYNTQQSMQGNNSGGYMADSISRQTISSEIHFSNMKKLGVESNTTNYMQMKDLVELTKKANEDKMDDMLVGGGK